MWWPGPCAGPPEPGAGPPLCGTLGTSHSGKDPPESPRHVLSGGAGSFQPTLLRLMLPRPFPSLPLPHGLPFPLASVNRPDVHPAAP